MPQAALTTAQQLFFGARQPRGDSTEVTARRQLQLVVNQLNHAERGLDRDNLGPYLQLLRNSDFQVSVAETGQLPARLSERLIEHLPGSSVDYCLALLAATELVLAGPLIAQWPSDLSSIVTRHKSSARVLSATTDLLRSYPTSAQAHALAAGCAQVILYPPIITAITTAWAQTTLASERVHLTQLLNDFAEQFAAGPRRRSQYSFAVYQLVFAETSLADAGQQLLRSLSNPQQYLDRDLLAYFRNSVLNDHQYTVLSGAVRDRYAQFSAAKLETETHQLLQQLLGRKASAAWQRSADERTLWPRQLTEMQDQATRQTRQGDLLADQIFFQQLQRMMTALLAKQLVAAKPTNRYFAARWPEFSRLHALYLHRPNRRDCQLHTLINYSNWLQALEQAISRNHEETWHLDQAALIQQLDRSLS